MLLLKKATPPLKSFYGKINKKEKKMEPLRKCKCGLEAYTEDDLELFTKGISSKYGRTNECKRCYGIKYKGKYLNPRKIITEMHGETGTRLHRIWTKMRTRCMNPKGDASKYYYDKGITVCPEWDSYLAFKKWSLNNGYEETLTIDRKNGNSGYEPTNCRWVNKSIQAANTKIRSDNSSGFRGVSWHEGDKKWRARVNYEGKTHYIGNFDSKINAAIEYNNFIIENELPHTLNIINLERTQK